MSYFSSLGNSEFSYKIKPRGTYSTNYTPSSTKNLNDLKEIDFDLERIKYEISMRKYPENIDLYNSILRKGYRKYAISTSQFYFQILSQENFTKLENEFLKKRIEELMNQLREKDKIISAVS